MKSEPEVIDIYAMFALMALMQKGGDEFKAQMGRPMSYGEMREMYG